MPAQALKEWAVACEALEAGAPALLIRKGGVHERRFLLPARRFLLFPTQVHQKAHLLKPHVRPRYEALSAAHDPAAPVRLRLLAELTDAFTTSDERVLAAVSPLHPWSEAYAAERLHWRPSQPLTLLLVRASPLLTPLELGRAEDYAGCRSWVELPCELPAAGPPAADEETYAHWQRRLEQALAPLGAVRL